jgi:large subunit ribosomal protein L4
MPEVALYNMKGKEVGTLSLPESVFGVEPNLGLIHQAVTTEEANARQGTADTKRRGEVRGGGRKPWRQKGTGRARQGSTRAPHWRHGGVVHGPHPRSYVKALPKSMRQSALRSALSAKVADGEVVGVDAFILDGGKPSTKSAATALNALPLKKEVRTKHYNGDDRIEGTREQLHKVLVIVPEYDETLVKSMRNLQNVTLRYAPNFSVRDVMLAGRVVVAQEAVARIEESLTKLNGTAVVVEEAPAKPKRARAAKAESPAVEAEVKPKRTRKAATEASVSAESATSAAEAETTEEAPAE